MDERTKRRLAAILAADVVGYSKMMAADEARTLEALKEHRQTLFEPAVQRHNGRIVKLIGDGTLVEFSSVVDAVRCALDVQLQIAQQPSSRPEIKLRIGVNLGDVIVEGDDIYGEGVNVAARLESLAEPGGICVASIVNESITGRVEIDLEDAGEVSVKNIDRPIRVWTWHPDRNARGDPAHGQTETRQQPQTDPPSIAVLPFDNMSNDPEQEYFSDGITEDIITDLSKIGSLIVISRSSSFVYKNKPVDARQVGRELRVRSVLEGSVRRSSNRVRITAQLIDATNGAHIWADRYDRDLTDIFEVQDDVTRQIVTALKGKLSHKEEERLRSGGTRNVEAHQLFLKGRELILGPTKNKAVFEEMVSLFEQAIALEPDYAEPHAGLGFAYILDDQNRWSDDPDSSLPKAKDAALQAVELDGSDPFAHNIASIVFGRMGQFDLSAQHLERALEINPNFAQALNGRGVLQIYVGRPSAGIPDIEKAIRLDPALAHQYLHFLGLAHFMLGNYETAATIYRERVLQVPDTDMTRAMLVATLGHLGEIDEAQRVWTELMQVNPSYSFSNHMSRLFFKDPDYVERIVEGMRKAGLHNVEKRAFRRS